MRNIPIFLLCLSLLAPLAAASSIPDRSEFIRAEPKAIPASATTPGAFSGQVIRVSDGDSVTVRYGQIDVSIRLADIDAPERGQPWSQRARQDLSRMVGGRVVEVIPVDKDRYGRTVARLRADGRNVNTEMVRLGSAWVYRAYLNDQSLLPIEADARQARRGLWSMPENTRVPPWEQRRQARTGVYGPEL